MFAGTGRIYFKNKSIISDFDWIFKSDTFLSLLTENTLKLKVSDDNSPYWSVALWLLVLMFCLVCVDEEESSEAPGVVTCLLKSDTYWSVWFSVWNCVIWWNKSDQCTGVRDVVLTSA